MQTLHILHIAARKLISCFPTETKVQHQQCLPRTANLMKCRTRGHHVPSRLPGLALPSKLPRPPTRLTASRQVRMLVARAIHSLSVLYARLCTLCFVAAVLQGCCELAPLAESEAEKKAGSKSSREGSALCSARASFQRVPAST